MISLNKFFAITYIATIVSLGVIKAEDTTTEQVSELKQYLNKAKEFVTNIDTEEIKEKLSIAEQCAQILLIEIAQGGCVDSFAAPLVTICCAALNGNKGDVGRIVLGDGCLESGSWLQVVRDLKLFFGVEGRFEQETSGNGLLCRWVGTGWVNSARGTK